MSAQKPSEYAGNGEHRTVSRVMTILEHVLGSGSDGMRLADLSVAMRAPKSSIHGLSRGLVATGYLREDLGRYFLGPAVAMLLASTQHAMPAAYQSAMERLTSRWGETTLLVSLVGDSVVYVAKEEPPAMVRASPQMNTRFSLWPRSSGKVFLAYMAEHRREAFLDKTFPNSTERDETRAVFERIRETRITTRVDSGETGVATPVLFHNRPVTTALSIVGPAERMKGKTEAIAEDMLETVQQITRETKPV